MKKIDSFVNKRSSYNSTTFNKIIEEYNKLKKEFEENRSIINECEKIISQNHNQNPQSLSLKEQMELYKIIQNSKGNIRDFYGIDLTSLEHRLKEVFPELNNYLTAIMQYNNIRSLINELLEERITFKAFEKENPFYCIIQIDNKLQCLYSDGEIEEFPEMTQEQLEFLSLCAKKQRLLLNDIKKEDLSFIQVLMKQQVNEYFNSTSDNNEEDYENWMEPIIQVSRIKRELEIAHKLDTQKDDDNTKKIISKERAKELITEIEKELERINTTNTRFKDLMIENCKTAKYEIRILSGEHIPTLYENIPEEDKIAFVKAYKNISNFHFRKNTSYFDNYYQALIYQCFTAHEEINDTILKIKLK